MKKRILSALLVTAMLLASSVSAFAALPSIGSIADYDKNTILEKGKAFLDELKSDASSDLWDKDYHAARLEAISKVREELKKADLSDVVSAIIDYEGLTDAQKLYLCALVKAKTVPEIEAILGAFDTSGLGWQQSFNALEGYESYLESKASTIIPYILDDITGPVDPDKIIEEGYKVLKGEARAFVEEALKTLVEISLSQNSTELKENYKKLYANDSVKKLVMILVAPSVNKEISEYSKSYIKEYLRGLKTDENIEKAKISAERVLAADIEDTVPVAFEELGKNLQEVYAGKEILPDLEFLFGDGVEEGLVESFAKKVDVDFEASNILINIALSKGIHLFTAGGRIEDIKENTASAGDFSNTTLKNEKSINIRTEDPASYGVDASPITLKTSWFDIEFYKEDGSKLSGVAFNDGQISVVEDSSRGVEKAYMVLYRKDSSGGVKTFIETYPVKVDFTEEGETVTPSGSSTKKYTVNFDTNGGSTIAPERYIKGTVVQLTQVPTKDGYIFDGWYSDAELTNKIETITIGENITVYAAWKKDGGAVVSKVEIPEILEDKDHYAYVMGYPEGDIRPNGNITRAEAVTMIFRLLKDDVRVANFTTENVFADVNENDWFNAAVSTLAKLGVVEGRTEDTFVPYANITRAEFATMFARLAQFEFVAESKYGDVDGHWAKKFVEEVDAYGWIAGYEDDTFRPDKNITRAEAMTLINRVLKRVPENKEALLDGMTIWTDNTDTSAWYYIAVQEATNSHEYEIKGAYEVWTKLVENKDWTAFEK